MSADIVARAIGAVLPSSGDAAIVVDLERAVAMRRVRGEFVVSGNSPTTGFMTTFSYSIHRVRAFGIERFRRNHRYTAAHFGHRDLAGPFQAADIAFAQSCVAGEVHHPAQPCRQLRT